MDKLSNWLQICANIGILGGLIMVGFQIYQANSLTAAQLFHENVESTINTQLSMVGENPDASMERIFFEPQLATRRDHLIAERYYHVTIRQLNRASIFAASGLYGGDSAVTPGAFIRLNGHIFASEHGVNWLKRIHVSIPEGRGRELYDELIAVAMAGLKQRKVILSAREK